MGEVPSFELRVSSPERTALAGRLAKVHYSPWSFAGGNKCSRKPQPRVVQLNTGNNGHHSTSRSSSSSPLAATGWCGVQAVGPFGLVAHRKRQDAGNPRPASWPAPEAARSWPAKFRGGKERIQQHTANPASWKPVNAIM